jgi:hypothetical protein
MQAWSASAVAAGLSSWALPGVFSLPRFAQVYGVSSAINRGLSHSNENIRWWVEPLQLQVAGPTTAQAPASTWSQSALWLMHAMPLSLK